MAKKRLIPFRWIPASWGLRGKSYKEAEANYYYDGEELEKKLVEFNYVGQDLEEKKLEIDLKYKKLDQQEYEKKLATLRKEPWVGAVESKYDGKQGLSGFYFKMDWNEYFIKMLNENGYTGITDDETVEQWFNDINRSYLEELVEDDFESFEAISKKRPGTLRLRDGNKSSYI